MRKGEILILILITFSIFLFGCAEAEYEKVTHKAVVDINGNTILRAEEGTAIITKEKTYQVKLDKFNLNQYDIENWHTYDNKLKVYKLVESRLLEKYPGVEIKNIAIERLPIKSESNLDWNYRVKYFIETKVPEESFNAIKIGDAPGYYVSKYQSGETKNHEWSSENFTLELYLPFKVDLNLSKIDYDHKITDYGLEYYVNDEKFSIKDLGSLRISSIGGAQPTSFEPTLCYISGEVTPQCTCKQGTNYVYDELTNSKSCQAAVDITDEDLEKIEEAIDKLKKINDKYETDEEVDDNRTEEELYQDIANQLIGGDTKEEYDYSSYDVRYVSGSINIEIQANKIYNDLDPLMIGHVNDEVANGLLDHYKIQLDALNKKMQAKVTCRELNTVDVCAGVDMTYSEDEYWNTALAYSKLIEITEHALELRESSQSGSYGPYADAKKEFNQDKTGSVAIKAGDIDELCNSVSFCSSTTALTKYMS